MDLDRRSAVVGGSASICFWSSIGGHSHVIGGHCSIQSTRQEVSTLNPERSNFKSVVRIHMDSTRMLEDRVAVTCRHFQAHQHLLKPYRGDMTRCSHQSKIFTQDRDQGITSSAATKFTPCGNTHALKSILKLIDTTMRVHERRKWGEPFQVQPDDT